MNNIDLVKKNNFVEIHNKNTLIHKIPVSPTARIIENTIYTNGSMYVINSDGAKELFINYIPGYKY